MYTPLSSVFVASPSTSVGAPCLLCVLPPILLPHDILKASAFPSHIISWRAVALSRDGEILFPLKSFPVTALNYESI